MNIAFFASAFYPSIGGVEECVRQLSHFYQRQGHKVLVVTQRWPRDLPRTEVFEGIPVYRSEFRVPEGSRRARTNYALTHGLLERGIHAALRQHKIDLIHVHCVSSNARYALRSCRKLGLPLITTLHGELSMDASGLFIRSEEARNALREALNSAGAITACSGQSLREAEAFYGRPFEKRGSVIYTGVKVQDFQNVEPYRHGKPYVFAIGRHVMAKGFDILLHAWAERKSDLDGFDLLIAGDGRESAALQTLSRELDLEGRVHFIGRVDRQQTAQLFAGCEFFVLPSRHEPMGIVNLEAMAAGKAVVATDVGGVPELITPDRNGLLVPGGDPPALGAGIVRIAHDCELRTRLVEAGQQRVKSFDWNEIGRQYLDITRAVLDKQ